jgi:hypothetical protein
LHQESVYLKAEETHYRAFHGVAVLYLFFIWLETRNQESSSPGTLGGRLIRIKRITNSWLWDMYTKTCLDTRVNHPVDHIHTQKKRESINTIPRGIVSPHFGACVVWCRRSNPKPRPGWASPALAHILRR